MNTFLQLLPLIILIGFNIIIGVIAMNMANKRGLRPFPAFWAGIFGSVLGLFIIAMHPIQER